MNFQKTYGRVKKYGAIIGIILSCAIMIGGADTWEDIRKESAKITSVNAQFIQEKHLQILTKPLLSKGRFYFQAPDSVRWEYTSPVKSVLLMNKGKIKRYTLGSKGIVEDTGGSAESMQTILQQIGRWSKGQFSEDEHFAATLKGGMGPKIILTPREKGLSAMISLIEIDFAAERPGVIKSIKIFENKENYTFFVFTDVQVNGKISERLFQGVE